MRPSLLRSVLAAFVVSLLAFAGFAWAQTPPAKITDLVPAGVAMGDPPPSLTVIGENFTEQSVVQFNGAARETRFVSSSRLAADLLPADLVAATVATVSVTGPGASNGLPFSVSPLKATLVFPPPCGAGVAPPCAPADAIYTLGTEPPPLTIFLQIRNVSGADVITPAGFTDDPDLVRRLYFTEPNGGIVINKAEEATHGDHRHYHCFSRRRVLQRPTAIPVVPGERLAPDFFREYKITDARLLYRLVQSGLHVVNARIPLLTFFTSNSAALIDDCDQFPGLVVLNVGGVSGSQAFTVGSNSLQFTVGADVTAPVTTVTRSVAPNAAGWNTTDVTLNFAATDDPSGSGVQHIVVTTTTVGAQTGEHILGGPNGSVTISAEGSTDVTYYAVDNAGNSELARVETVRIDTKPPVIALSPASGTRQLNATIVVTFAATDTGGSGVATTQATLTKPGLAPTTLTSPASITLDKPGTTTVAVTAGDFAGKTATSTEQYAVTYRFSGFAPPVTSDSACGNPPCATYNQGRTLPVKFQLLDANNAVVSTAVATIAVRQLSGTPPSTPPIDLGTGTGDTGNRFRFDGSQYIFNLDTKVLAVGVWRVDAVLDDGTVHSVRIGLR